MSAVVQPKLITAEEFEQFESEVRCDLIRGELRPMPPQPGAKHGVITYNLAFQLGAFIFKHDLGICFAAETRFTIEHNPDTSIGPDWAYVAKARLPKEMPDGFLPFAPDALLEVRSPSDRKREVEEKIARWIAAGVRIVWELNPKLQVLTVYRPGREPRRLGIDEVMDGEDVLPGFSLPLRRLFEDEKDAPA